MVSARVAGLVGAAVLLTGCAARSIPARRARVVAEYLRPLESLTCPDGEPLRILISPDCQYGICGWSCAPGRWTADYVF